MYERWVGVEGLGARLKPCYLPEYNSPSITFTIKSFRHYLHISYISQQPIFTSLFSNTSQKPCGEFPPGPLHFLSF